MLNHDGEKIMGENLLTAIGLRESNINTENIYREKDISCVGCILLFIDGNSFTVKDTENAKRKSMKYN